MFTHYYKGGYIHGYFDKPTCKVSVYSVDPSKEFKSYSAAQLAITKATKEHDRLMMKAIKGGIL